MADSMDKAKTEGEPLFESMFEFVWACGDPSQEARAIAGVERGYWKRGRSDGESGLAEAARGGCLAVVKALLAAGAPIEGKDEAEGLSPLLWACSRDRAQCLRELLGAGADLASVDAAGRTALMVAAGNGSNLCVEELIARGAELDALSREGCTALLHACEHGDPETVDLLLRAGADLDAARPEGFPSMGDICQGRPEIALMVGAERARRESAALECQARAGQARPRRGGAL